jgi:hypothetical protein
MRTIHDYGQSELGTRRDAEFDGRCNVVLIEVKGFDVISTNLYLTGRVYALRLVSLWAIIFKLCSSFIIKIVFD